MNTLRLYLTILIKESSKNKSDRFLGLEFIYFVFCIVLIYETIISFNVIIILDASLNYINLLFKTGFTSKKADEFPPSFIILLVRCFNLIFGITMCTILFCWSE